MEEFLEDNHKKPKFSNTNLHIQFQIVLIQESHQGILDTADLCPLNVSRDSETRTDQIGDQ